MSPLSLQRKRQIRLNLIVSAALILVYLATYLLAGGQIPLFYFFETAGTLALLALVFHRVPTMYYLSLVAFACVAQYGGTMFDLYRRFPRYDQFLHLASGVLLVFMGHYFFTLLLRRHRDYGPPLAMTLWFCWLFSLACAGLWEIYEFSVDQLFGLDSQLWTLGFGGLVDTMSDLIMGAVGASTGVVPLWAALRGKMR